MDAKSDSPSVFTDLDLDSFTTSVNPLSFEDSRSDNLLVPLSLSSDLQSSPTQKKKKRKLSPSDSTASPAPKAKKPRIYVPRSGSGAYALLLTLHDAGCRLCKEDLVAQAKKYCDKAFEVKVSRERHGTRDFYTSWNCIKDLVKKHQYVQEFWMNRKKYFELTPKGKDIASKMAESLCRPDPALGSLSSSYMTAPLPATTIGNGSRDENVSWAWNGNADVMKSCVGNLPPVRIPRQFSAVISLSDDEDDIVVHPHMDASGVIVYGDGITIPIIRNPSQSSSLSSLTSTSLSSSPSALSSSSTLQNSSSSASSSSTSPSTTATFSNLFPSPVHSSSSDASHSTRTSSLGISPEMSTAQSFSFSSSSSSMSSLSSSNLDGNGVLQSLGRAGAVGPGQLLIDSSVTLSDVYNRSLKYGNDPNRIFLSPQEASQYELVLVSDTREAMPGRREAISDKMNDMGVRGYRRQLNLGDYLWVLKPTNDVEKDEIIMECVIERKTLDDLFHSICDGRFREQMQRLQATSLQIIYLIEGKISEHNRAIDPKILKGAEQELHLRGMHVHRTDDSHASLRYLLLLRDVLLDIVARKGVVAGWKYEAYQNTFKHSNKLMSVGDVWARMLLQIPGLGVKKAKAIANTYPTIASLLKKYREVSPQEGVALLKHLRADPTATAVGPKQSQLVYELVMGREYRPNSL